MTQAKGISKTAAMKLLDTAVHEATETCPKVAANVWSDGKPKDSSFRKSAESRKKDHEGFYYAPAADVKAALRPHLLSHGLSLRLKSCEVARAELTRDLRADMYFELIHAPGGGRVEFRMLVPVKPPEEFVDTLVAVQATITETWRMIAQQLLCVEFTYPDSPKSEPAPATARPEPALVSPPTAERPTMAEDVIPQATKREPLSPAELVEMMDLAWWWVDQEKIHDLAEGVTPPRTLFAEDAWTACTGEPARLPATEQERRRLYDWLRATRADSENTQGRRTARK